MQWLFFNNLSLKYFLQLQTLIYLVTDIVIILTINLKRYAGSLMMRALHPLDFLFLSLEKRQQPMHVGGLFLFQILTQEIF